MGVYVQTVTLKFVLHLLNPQYLIFLATWEQWKQVVSTTLTYPHFKVAADDDESSESEQKIVKLWVEKLNNEQKLALKLRKAEQIQKIFVLMNSLQVHH